MAALLSVVLPLALGAAVSPTLLALEVLVLSGPRHPVARAWAVAGGAAIVLGLYAVLGLTVLENFSGHRAHSPVDVVIDLGAALLLVLVAARNLRRHPTPGERHQGRMASRLSDAPTVSFLAFGAVAMLVNFSTLVLFLPALHQISHSSVGLIAKVGVGLVLVVITLLPVLAPALLVSAIGHRADPLLARLNRFVGDHSRQITATIAIVFAVLLLVKGIREIG